MPSSTQNITNANYVRELIELVEKNGVSSIEITRGDESIKIHKQQQVVTDQQSLPAINPPATQPLPNAGVVQGASEKAIGTTTKEVTSPMVGTFYTSPSPDSPAFVQVGDVVNKGDTLCIIEAMKMLNQIKAEESGTIDSIHVEDGAPVEFGQKLFSLK